MKGCELLAILNGLTDEQLNLFVMTVGVNTAEGEGVQVGSAPRHMAWVPDPVLVVAALDTERTSQWWEMQA